MRIGILANTFDPAFGEKAGGHVHFFEVAKRWLDDDLWIFAPSVAAETVRRELPLATFVAMPAIDRIGNYQLRYLVRTVFSIARLRALRSCDVLLATSHFAPDVVPAVLALPRRCVVCVHHILPPARERSGGRIRNSISAAFQMLSFALIRRFARAVLVNARETSVRIGVDANRTRTYVMSHGVQQSDEVVEPGGRRYSGVYLGRLVPTKGVDDLFRAWQLVRERVPEATLTIVGGGEPGYERYLSELADELGLAKTVRFAGRVDDDEKIALLRSASAFVFPSKEEGFGIAIGEAMASGLPCVVYDLPAYRDVFVGGRLTASVGDVAGFAQLVVRLFLDDDLRTRLSHEASELARSFSWETAAAIERRALHESAL